MIWTGEMWLSIGTVIAAIATGFFVLRAAGRTAQPSAQDAINAGFTALTARQVEELVARLPTRGPDLGANVRRRRELRLVPPPPGRGGGHHGKPAEPSPLERLERVEPAELVDGELDVRSGGVLFDACDAAGAGDGSDVLTPAEEPGQRGLGRGGADLGTDGGDLVDESEVALEVVAGEARIGLAPVVVAEVVDGADLSGEQAVAEG